MVATQHMTPWAARRARTPARSIGELAHSVRTVDPSLPCAALDRVFVEDPGLTAVLLDCPAGEVRLISRARFLTTLTGPLGYGRALLLRCALDELTAVETLVLEAETLLVVAAAATTTREAEYRQDDMVVRFADGSLGLLPVAELFAELALGFERLAMQNASILEAAGEGIYGLDAGGRTIFANPAAERLTGHAPGELLGRLQRELVHHTRVDGTPCPVEECPVRASLVDGTVHCSDDDLFWRKDGTSFPAEFTSTPLLEDGRVEGVVVVFKDITERRAVERAKDEFTSVVSHELRTPLTSIRGSLGLLESGVLGALPEKGQRMVQIAVQNTDRLGRLINDILDIERIDAGAIDMHQVPCTASELVERAVAEMEPVAAAARIVLEDQAHPVALAVDPDRIHQTLINLISNAIKFSPAASTIGISVARRGDQALFEVRDRGRGIPAGCLETIFERFSQVDASDSRQKGGTGLGLAICRTIVEHHGGRIWAESRLDTGSTFSFLLPAQILHGQNSTGLPGDRPRAPAGEGAPADTADGNRPAASEERLL